ncbi:hypothetical protein SRHO_G00228640 [Serrasalmus rhombeus]
MCDGHFSHRRATFLQHEQLVITRRKGEYSPRRNQHYSSVVSDKNFIAMLLISSLSSPELHEEAGGTLINMFTNCVPPRPIDLQEDRMTHAITLSRKQWKGFRLLGCIIADNKDVAVAFMRSWE